MALHMMHPCREVFVQFVSHLTATCGARKAREKDQRQQRQRSFPCSEAGGNNGLLDQRLTATGFPPTPSSTQVGWPIHKSLLFLQAFNSLTSSNDALCKGMRREGQHGRCGGGRGEELTREIK
ncbi:hypothetical protein PBY51_021620 [Eleginops maclovinus]|uniref:Uncharacterized protein n=1 Tax=Eleginops maclovinus TaxID=56733 RepID=A0AAN7XFW2_ELEMC|nr:hypothetical protein PBY51_021620 [Eleginops maclovinus]